MLLKTTSGIPYSEITPKNVYLNRRTFLASAAAAGAVTLAHPLSEWFNETPAFAAVTKLPNLAKSPNSSKNESITPYKVVTTYNNFLEFDVDQGDASKKAAKFPTSPWSVAVEGEVANPRTFTIDEINRLTTLEERIYRHRCVEAWSIVVPWIGFSFSALAKTVRPNGKAKYVAFQSYYDPKEMPLARNQGAEVPYLEALRLDEAMHPLALLCVGMYGETLPNQNGAPVRMVIPWKYGYKSAKSLVKIRFLSDQPPTTWNKYSPGEYGFYSNVNPLVQTRRYSQAMERRLDGSFFGKNIKTTMFNGYADQVANLYTGMDLRKYY